MNILIVRHGQTDVNLERILQGLTDNPLNDTGREQAQIAKQKLEDEPIDLMICSPLVRARETADIINKGRNIKIIYDDRIVERDFGEFEGDYIKNHDMCEFWSYKANKKYEKAENIKEFFNKIYSFLDDIKEKYKGKNILLVAHSGVSIAVKCYFEGIPEDDKLIEIRLKNCEIAKYEV